jgi:predicted metal-dependent phosphoesterase TrpH
MSKWIDLHLHTIASDGTSTATEVVERAKKLQINAIAITDHDSVESIHEARILGRKLGIEVIPGIELSAYSGESEIHILGYYFDDQNHDFIKKLDELCIVREQRIHQIVEKLRQNNVDISIDDVLKFSGEGAVGRLHVARALVQKGVVANTNEAFKKFLANGKSAYVPKERLTTKETIELLLKIGGVPVIAHPALLGRDDLIPKLVEEGLKGIEVFHPEHSLGKVEHYKKLAKDYNLIITGGSDCHGMAKGKILMGIVKVPYELLEPLKNVHLSLN